MHPPCTAVSDIDCFVPPLFLYHVPRGCKRKNSCLSPLWCLRVENCQEGAIIKPSVAAEKYEETHRDSLPHNVSAALCRTEPGPGCRGLGQHTFLAISFVTCPPPRDVQTRGSCSLIPARSLSLSLVGRTGGWKKVHFIAFCQFPYCLIIGGTANSSTPAHCAVGFLLRVHFRLPQKGDEQLGLTSRFYFQNPISAFRARASFTASPG